MAAKKWFTLKVFEGAVDQASTVNIIFLHGISADAHGTWTGPNNQLWCPWLTEAIPGARVIVIDYIAPRFAVTGGKRLSIADHAVALTEELTANHVADLPVVFIAHSLGGIIVKHMLHFAAHAKSPRHRALINATMGAIFIATPHRGTQIASVASQFPGATTILKELRKGEPANEDVAQWYTEHAVHYGVRTVAFFERKQTGGVLIVPSDSADPRTPDCDPVPMDRNHVTIARVAGRGDGVFPGVVEDITGWLARPRQKTARIDEDELNQISVVATCEPAPEVRAMKVASILRATAHRIGIRFIAFADDRGHAPVTALVNNFADADALGLVDLVAAYPAMIAFRITRPPALG